jgi:hypothetical protein
MARRSVKTVLVRALARIEKYGWIQNSAGNTKEGFCVLGAFDWAHSITDSTYYDARHAFMAIEPAISQINRWNDAKGRTKRHVIARFRAAIKAAS